MKKILKFCLFIFVTCLLCNAAFSANKDCAKLLAEDIVNAVLTQDVDVEKDTVTISSDNLIPFFVANIDVCRDYLLARTEPEDIFVNSDDLVMDLDWNYIIQEVTAALTTASDMRQIFVCENNRSGQVLLDGVLWIPTAVATVMSFDTAGVAGANSVIKQGAKNFVKIGVKKGVKNAAVEGGAKRMGQAAASTALKRALTTFAISTPIALVDGFGTTAYAWLESKFDPKVMNCHGTNRRAGCYLSCTKDNLTAPSDDLNTKVFKRILGKNLCVDETNNYVLREIKDGGIPTAGDILYTTEAKWAEVKQSIVSNVVEQGHCDWKRNDIDMFVAVPLYDESTLLPTGNGATGLIIDGLRIDD